MYQGLEDLDFRLDMQARSIKLADLWETPSESGLGIVSENQSAISLVG